MATPTNFRTLSDQEVLSHAHDSMLFQRHMLFTELALRLERSLSKERNFKGERDMPANIDAR